MAAEAGAGVGQTVPQRTAVRGTVYLRSTVPPAGAPSKNKPKVHSLVGNRAFIRLLALNSANDKLWKYEHPEIYRNGNGRSGWWVHCPQCGFPFGPAPAPGGSYRDSPRWLPAESDGTRGEPAVTRTRGPPADATVTPDDDTRRRRLPGPRSSLPAPPSPRTGAADVTCVDGSGSDRAPAARTRARTRVRTARPAESAWLARDSVARRPFLGDIEVNPGGRCNC